MAGSASSVVGMPCRARKSTHWFMLEPCVKCQRRQIAHNSGRTSEKYSAATMRSSNTSYGVTATIEPGDTTYDQDIHVHRYHSVSTSFGNDFSVSADYL